MVCRFTTRSWPLTVSRSASSSRSGSFISQCESRRSRSRCGPPPSKPRAHSQIWSDNNSATRPSPSCDSTSSGFCVRSLHDRRAVGVPGIDDAEPFAPFRRRRVGAFEAARHRMALAEFGERRAKRLLGDIAARLGRQDGVERGAPDAGRARIVRAGRDQDRAAVAHIARDVVEIDDRQHALARVTIEDDELEFVDLLLEQLARRKGDQRQFVDRRAVLFFRRPQNGEMDEIDRGIGFEKVTPSALAGMRFA